jgi:glycosyltransferase XagB
MTWRVHMRDPARLWRDLGPKGFCAFQILFLGSLSHALLAPLLLSYWAMTFGLPHPVTTLLPTLPIRAMTALFLTCEALNFTLGLIALRRTRHRFNPLWLLTLGLYHPLGTLAAYKALWELVRRPFYWDKTGHGAVSAPGEA